MAKGKDEKRRSVMVRRAENIAVKEAIGPTAGLHDKEMIAPTEGLSKGGRQGTKMPRPGEQQTTAGALRRTASGVTMPRPGRQAAAAPPPPSGQRMQGSGRQTTSAPPPPAKGMPGSIRSGTGMEAAPSAPRILRKPDGGIPEHLAERSAPSAGVRTGFDYPSTLRGSTAHFNVYYDPSLGANGPIIADGVWRRANGNTLRCKSTSMGLPPPDCRSTS